ncbi:MAG: AmmeMemoRadiSam system radical SAM enzyme [Deltaproteobacteria bacterium]|nr:AmmeMemoRadiSam system radical SAM enzyme [Deltaproteobacteria bacterium]
MPKKETVSRALKTSIVQCELCPKGCRIAPGQSGDCRVRVNLDGRLLAVVYGHPVTVHIDPMEKKPLFHFLPASRIFSLATVGCNLHCKNCQNWEISQADPWDTESYEMPPANVVSLARENECPSIAYTYTEPLVYYEYTLDTCIRAHENKIRNVLVTAGFANPKPLRKLYPHVDAANIDVKAMSNDFYRRICDAELKPVLTAIELAKEQGVWVEVTNLVIPTLNDDPKLLSALARWMVRSLGADTPLHFSAFYPRHKLIDLPETPMETLVKARAIAQDQGLRYVYIGNVSGTIGENTYCPHDGGLLIERVGYSVTSNRIDSEGRCPQCGNRVAGIWR